MSNKLGYLEKAIQHFKKAFEAEPKQMNVYHRETLALMERNGNNSDSDLLDKTNRIKR